jgi:hypothetical protein
VLRLSLHPDGLADRIENLAQWRSYVFRRLEEQIEVSADPVLAALLEELRSYPGGTGDPDETNGVAILLKVRLGPNLLSFLTMTTVFGTPIDITLSELAVEAFLPADPETATLLRG